MRVLPLLFLMLFAGCRDFAVDANDEVAGRRFRSFDVEANIPFDISPGDEAYLAEADLTLTFSLVLEDTRCPATEECTSPGKAGLLLDISRGIGDDSQVILIIPGEVPTPYRLNDFVQHRQERFQLLSLSPYPSTGQDVPDLYTASILIDR